MTNDKANTPEPKPSLLNDLENIRLSARSTAIALGRFFAHGTSQYIGPAATVALKKTGEGAKAIYSALQTKVFPNAESESETPGEDV